ncbi:chromate transport protein ChrA [Desulfosporosinus acidiphilus SJ4]|uniref:Chromate transport protein ChrA n=1 Tax=Desulfosporosinus acidiphilus (strain DSM 22704 / JCM 16185 / SJ4) TaxID=646529 RepID=I4D788_DESAJ|nr:chromate transporter [Desulfosporosinus acidiphilus]AFM41662.1 chromate transport protein ChrA [Desulfosporosinus acidiphilus SJ4]
MEDLSKLDNHDDTEKNSLDISWQKVAAVYLKIGTIGFGGGYAVMDLIHSELVDKKQWLSEQRYKNTLSLAEMAPGALTVNILAGIAYRLGGIKTMVLATAALLFPSFLLIVTLAGIFLRLEGNYLVRGAMEGLTSGVVGLMLAVVWDLVKRFPHRWYYYLSATCALAASLLLKLNPIWLVLLGAGTGAFKFFIQRIFLK